MRARPRGAARRRTEAPGWGTGPGACGIIHAVRKILFLLAAGLTLTASARLLASPPPLRVMITGFDPFDGRARNNAWDVAQAVTTRGELGPDVVVSTCHIPVVYDQGAQTAESCYEQLETKPDVVISLGEAGCSLRMETAAHNVDDTPGFPDNAGNIREGTPIDPDGPAHIGFNLPAPEMYCELSSHDRKATEVSETPGGFVCNNTAYHLARYFDGKPVQYGFIHVPASDCGADAADPQRTAKQIAKMLHRLANYDEAPVDERASVLPHCSNDLRLPTSADGVTSLLDALSQVDSADCRRDFLERLKERL